jgi:hypothetical protein
LDSEFSEAFFQSKGTSVTPQRLFPAPCRVLVFDPSSGFYAQIWNRVNLKQQLPQTKKLLCFRDTSVAVGNCSGLTAARATRSLAASRLCATRQRVLIRSSRLASRCCEPRRIINLENVTVKQPRQRPERDARGASGAGPATPLSLSPPTVPRHPREQREGREPDPSDRWPPP